MPLGEDSTQRVAGFDLVTVSGCAGQPGGPKLGDKGRGERLSDLAGRHANDARAGLESDVANADPPEIWGGPCGTEQEIDADNSPGSPG